MNIVNHTKERYLEYKKRHKKILDAAIKVFNKKGYGLATTAEISQEAGVSEPILYKHFTNKKELFLECFRSITDHLLKSYNQIYKKHPDDELKYLIGLITVYVDFVKQNPDKSMFLVHIFSYRSDSHFEEAFKAFMNESVRLIGKVIESGKSKGVIKSNIKSNTLACMYVNQYITIVALNDFLGPQSLTIDLILEWVFNMLKIEEA